MKETSESVQLEIPDAAIIEAERCAQAMLILGREFPFATERLDGASEFAAFLLAQESRCKQLGIYARISFVFVPEAAQAPAETKPDGEAPSIEPDATTRH